METKEILDEIGMRRSMTRIAHEIIEHNKGVNDVVFVGIKTRGEILANRLCDMIEHIEDCKVPCYALDVSHWRDDLEEAYIEMEEEVTGCIATYVDEHIEEFATIVKN